MPALTGYEGELNVRGHLVHKYQGLTIVIDLNTKRVTVAGSLAAYVVGDNVTSCSFHVVRSALQCLADALGVSPSEVRVHRLETGHSLPTNDAPTGFLAKIARSTYGSQLTPFYATAPPAASTRPLQFVARINNAKIKVYDKGTYAKLKGRPLPPGGNSLRFEVAYLKSRRIGAALGWKKGMVTLAHLMQPDVYEKLAAQLLESWYNLNLPPSMNAPNLNMTDRALLIAGQSPEFWTESKQTAKPATYYRLHAHYRELVQQQGQQHQQNPYTNDLKNQVIALLPKPTDCPV